MPFVGSDIPTVGTRRGNSGFTVIELMITLVVAAILFGIAIPNLRTFIQNSRMTTQSNDVVGELALARSEAIKLNQNVVVCRSNNPTAATPTCANDLAGTWETGWITFMDFGDLATAPNNSFALADGDVLLRQHDTLTGSNTLRSSDTKLADMVIFQGSGVVKTDSLASQIYLKVCDDRGPSRARAIVFETTGRTHIAQPSSPVGFPAGLTCP